MCIALQEHSLSIAFACWLFEHCNYGQCTHQALAFIHESSFGLGLGYLPLYCTYASCTHTPLQLSSHPTFRRFYLTTLRQPSTTNQSSSISLPIYQTSLPHYLPISPGTSSFKGLGLLELAFASLTRRQQHWSPAFLGHLGRCCTCLYQSHQASATLELAQSWPPWTQLHLPLQVSPGVSGIGNRPFLAISDVAAFASTSLIRRQRHWSRAFLATLDAAAPASTSLIRRQRHWS